MADTVKLVEIDHFKEKLIELLGSLQDYGIKRTPGLALPSLPCNEIIADHLIANGVTVQDGKPLEAFLHPIDAYKGLKAKYLVFKSDTGEKVDNCFVLCPGRDPAATEALRAYANATDNETLAEDIYNWVGKGETVQQWIPVTERLPEVVDSYIVVVKCKYDWEKEYEIGVDVATYDPYSDNPYIDGCWNTYNDWDEGQQYLHITHWMPLPKPPKE